MYDEILRQFPHKITLLTRDAADLISGSWPQLLQNEQLTFIITLAQLQKLCHSVYYPKTILFSMQLAHLVEALHKFTITYPCTLVVFHQGHLVVAKDGQVTSTSWEDPMLIWRGTVAAKAAVYALQHPKSPLQAITTALSTGE